MRLTSVFLLLLACAASAQSKGARRVPLRDLHPSFLKTKGRVLRSRTQFKPGIIVADKTYRGLNVPAACRMGYDIDACFSTFTVKVGVLGTGKHSIRFVVRGRGKVLASTPPLFPGTPPVELKVPIDGVLLLELETIGRIGRGAWIGGVLRGADDKGLGRFFADDASFDPRAYPAEFKRRVNEGIDRGVRFLLKQQTSSGWFEVGTHQALCQWKPNNTYTCAVLLMAIEARYFPGGHLDRRAAIDRPKLAKKLISEADMKWIRSLADWLVDQQGAGYAADQKKLYPVWRYPHGGYDLSNTQYALFGLTA
ncbi:MAG: NPCBM/NEW2 domain-containing protein, partial [Planctomycetota bacterium]